MPVEPKPACHSSIAARHDNSCSSMPVFSRESERPVYTMCCLFYMFCELCSFPGRNLLFRRVVFCGLLDLFNKPLMAEYACRVGVCGFATSAFRFKFRMLPLLDWVVISFSLLWFHLLGFASIFNVIFFRGENISCAGMILVWPLAPTSRRLWLCLHKSADRCSRSANVFLLIITHYIIPYHSLHLSG